MNSPVGGEGGVEGSGAPVLEGWGGREGAGAPVLEGGREGGRTLGYLCWREGGRELGHLCWRDGNLQPRRCYKGEGHEVL